MEWLSNGDAPIYIWEDDTWLNQKNKIRYFVNINENCWQNDFEKIYFTKKTKIMKSLPICTKKPEK